MDLAQYKKDLDTPEMQAKMDDYFIKINQRAEIKDNQMVRLKERVDKDPEYFKLFVDKVSEKYESDEYRDRERKIGRQPTTSLFFFLLEFAEVYGRECNEEEFEKHGNGFTGALYYFGGYYFNLMIGQGSLVLVTKK